MYNQGKPAAAYYGAQTGAASPGYGTAAPVGATPLAGGAAGPLPPGIIYDWTKDVIYAPDELAATALDGHDGKYNRKYFGTKIKVVKKKKGQLVYPGKPGDYAQGLVPPHAMKSDIYTLAGAQPGAPVYDPYKDVIYAPDAVTATALDLQDGGVNRKYHDTKIKIKKSKAEGYNPYYPLAAKQPLVHGYQVPGTSGQGVSAAGGYSAGGAAPYGPAPYGAAPYGPAFGGAYASGTPYVSPSREYASGAPYLTSGSAGYNTGPSSPALLPPAQSLPVVSSGNYRSYSPGLATPYGAGPYETYW